MMALIEFIIGGAWQYLLMAVGALAILWGARRSGVKSEQNKQLKRSHKAAQKAREVEDEVRKSSPDDVRDRLRGWDRD